ncbi:MAG: KEOPS complex N(6)-L-threonylcarbamoyladenine synthase Kae1 [Candidatus Micrarchaeia archaeon]
MIVLGIESSAHTFGAGIVESGHVLANEKAMYSVGTRGIIPAQVASFHAKHAAAVIKKALDKAGLKATDIDGIGYTKGPGIGTCLQIGMLAAKTLAYELNISILPINHAVAHIEIAKHFAKLHDPVALYVSGGNSQILKLDKEHMRYAVMGETFDIGIGNMLDNFARAAGLKPAWGSTVAEMAKKGSFVSLPYTVKGMDFTFTGLLTNAIKKVGNVPLPDLCFSIQEVGFSMLCEATERALLLTKSKELCVCGGVAQSERLKEMLGKLADEHGIKFGYAPNEYNADNGAMIAYVAEKGISKGKAISPQACTIKQKYRIEEAEVWQ